MTPRLHWNGEGSDVVALLAAGAGLHCRAPWMETVAKGLADRGIAVARFDFPYMEGRADGTSSRRPPDPMPKLLDAMRESAAAARRANVRFALLGKSMGGRVATMLADELCADAVVVFGYPFHPPRKPTELRTAHLLTMRTPTRILQGERDPFGQPDEVAGYGLPAHVEVIWFPGGDHSLEPNKRSGIDAGAAMARALDLAAAACRGTDGGTSTQPVLG